MKTLIVFTLIFFSSILLFSQTNPADSNNKNKWIDGITLIPLNAQLVISSSNNEIFEKEKTPFGGSIHPQILFQNQLKNDIDLLVGFGYSSNSESAKISKELNSFATIAGLNWSNFNNEDADLKLRKVNYIDEYLTASVGLKFYSKPKEKRKIKLVLSTKLEASYLLNSEVDVDIVRETLGGIFGLTVMDKAIYNTNYETEAEVFFENMIEEFLLNLQIGVGYEWRVKKHFSFGHEFVMNAFLMEHKTDLLKKKAMLGTQLSLTYHFK